MQKLISIDTSRFYAAAQGDNGIHAGALAGLKPALRAAHARVEEGNRHGLNGEFACLNLGQTMPPHLAEIQDAAGALRRFRDVLVIGIGGSSLGTKAIRLAIGSHQPAGTPRIHFVENIDTFQLEHLLSGLEPASTALVCISKSGGTIESVVHYLVLRDWLNRAGGEAAARQQQWVITDPECGWLRALATRERIPALAVPQKVGGRFSVLTAVGLLPLASQGIDINALLRGAADNAARCTGSDPATNPALEIAACCYLLDHVYQKRIAVMMPYVNRLQLFVDWYCQLWAESLGKWDPAGNNGEAAGTLPVRAMGAIDQHSQLQMYLESRRDKFFTFIELEHWEHDRNIPLNDFDSSHFPYLSGRSMAEVIDAEFRATRQVITDAGHPNMTIRLPALDAHAVGQMIDLYQRVTVYTGLLYGINPLDQPSVEKGKRLAIQYLRDKS